MQWSATSDATTLTIKLCGERRRSDILHFAIVAACLIGIHFLIGERIERIIGMSISFLWALGIALRQQYGTSILTVTNDTVSLNRHTLGLGRTRTFPRSDT